MRSAGKGFSGIIIDHICVQSTFEGNPELLSGSICRALGFPAMMDLLGTQDKRFLLMAVLQTKGLQHRLLIHMIAFAGEKGRQVGSLKCRKPIRDTEPYMPAIRILKKWEKNKQNVLTSKKRRGILQTYYILPLNICGGSGR